ncbi:MAG: hypothetical protein KKH91_05145 [Elusimicrobia bacterium]|nr:hypothetical protein [Elusimicrobiota bacterium]
MNKIQDASVLLIGRVLQMVAAVISLRLLTTFLLPNEVGRYYIILSVIAWFGGVFINPICMYVSRKLIEWNLEGLSRKYMLKFAVYLIYITAFSLILTLIFLKLFGIGTNVSYFWMSSILVGNLLFVTLTGTMLNNLNILGHRIYFVLFTNLTLWFGLAISILLVKFFSPQAEYWIFGSIISNVIILLFSAFILWKMLNVSTNNDDLPYKNDKSFSFLVVFKFSIPLAVTVCFYWLHTQSYRFILGFNSQENLVGLFAAGYSVAAGIMIAFENLFGQFYNPYFFNQIANKDKQQKAIAWNKYADCFIPSIVIMGVFISCSAHFLIKIFVGSKFQNVPYIVLGAALIETVRLIGSSYYMAALAQIDMKILVVPQFIGAAIVLLGIFTTLQINPFASIIISMLLGYIVTVVLVDLKLKNELPVKFPWVRFFKSFSLMIPFIVLTLLLTILIPIPNFKQSLLVVCFGGVYMILAQYIISKSWLFEGLRLKGDIA